MALSGVEIFKHLPKTNCKKCGHPTCLAFAMKLAAKQASLDSCPDASDDAKKILGESAAPPIRDITLGVGDKAVKIEEQVTPDALAALSTALDDLRALGEMDHHGVRDGRRPYELRRQCQ